MSQKQLFFIILLLIFFAPKAYASVVINEFQIEPTTNQWVELFNNGNDVVDISGWVIDDSGGTEKFIIPENTLIARNSFQLFESGKFNFNKSSADSVRFFNFENSLVDSKEYPGSSGQDVTIGRYPDGGNNWGICTPTPSGNNNCVSPTPTSTLILTPTETLTPTPSPKPTYTPSPSPKSTVTQTPSPTPRIPTIIPTALPDDKNKLYPTSVITMVLYKEATFSSELISTDSSEVLGIGTASSMTKSEKIRPTGNYYIIFAGILFLVGSLVLLYTAKQHEKNSK